VDQTERRGHYAADLQKAEARSGCEGRRQLVPLEDQSREELLPKAIVLGQGQGRAWAHRKM
jgi:hypothetical protein